MIAAQRAGRIASPSWRLTLCALLGAAAACTSVGGGSAGGGSYGPPPAQIGQACDPAYQQQTCLGEARLRCDAPTLQWVLLGFCAAPQTCVGTPVPDSAAWTTACSAPAAATDAGGAIDGGATGGGQDSGAQDSGGNGRTGPQDAGPVQDSGGALDTGAGSVDVGSVPFDAGPSTPDASSLPPPAIAVQGGFLGAIDGKTWSVPYGPGPYYGGMQVAAGLAHKQTAQGSGCVTQAAIALARHDGSCKLQLVFALDFSGKMKLTKAAFHARALNYGENGYPPGQYPCVDWTDEPASGAVVYEMVESNVTLDTGGPVQQPWASQPTPTLAGATLQVGGSAKMVAGGRSFTLQFNGLRLQGPIPSQGDSGAYCGGSWTPIPDVTLKDINPKSPSYGQMVNTNSFKGKRVAILMGAGWCASCIAQAEYMETVKQEMLAAGKNDFQMLVLNAHTANTPQYQAAITGQKKKVTFPVLQSTSTSNGWAVFSGKKNDCFMYKNDGKPAFKHIGKATVNLTQFKKDLYSGLSN